MARFQLFEGHLFVHVIFCEDNWNGGMSHTREQIRPKNFEWYVSIAFNIIVMQNQFPIFRVDI